jgi:hypothetical protein
MLVALQPAKYNHDIGKINNTICPMVLAQGAMPDTFSVRVDH